VSPVSVIRKYIGVKITNKIASQARVMPIFLAVRNARKAVRHPSNILNNFIPWNPNWQNGDAIIVNTGLPQGSRKRWWYLNE